MCVCVCVCVCVYECLMLAFIFCCYWFLKKETMSRVELPVRQAGWQRAHADTAPTLCFTHSHKPTQHSKQDYKRRYLEICTIHFLYTYMYSGRLVLFDRYLYISILIGTSKNDWVTLLLLIGDSRSYFQN